jgi:YtcA family
MSSRAPDQAVTIEQQQTSGAIAAEAKHRQPLAALAACATVLLLLGGCSGAPSQNILGSYFPSWMICALVGIGLAVMARQGLALAGVDKFIPVPLLVYLAFAVFFSFATWLVWLG